jgi:hypothetical protein
MVTVSGHDHSLLCSVGLKGLRGTTAAQARVYVGDVRAANIILLRWSLYSDDAYDTWAMKGRLAKLASTSVMRVIAVWGLYHVS